MKQVGSYEAKTHLPELLDSVERNRDTILITRRGVPVALLSPVQEQADHDVSTAVEKMLAFRETRKRTLGKITWRDLIEEGRRF